MLPPFGGAYEHDRKIISHASSFFVRNEIYLRGGEEKKEMPGKGARFHPLEPLVERFDGP